MFGLHFGSLFDALKAKLGTVLHTGPLLDALSELHDAPTKGAGTVRTHAVLLAVHRDVAQKLLPDEGLELEQQTVVPYPFHPLLLLFSHFKFDTIPPFATKKDFDYNELLVAVPFTRHPISFNVLSPSTDVAPFGPLSYITRFYLDKNWPQATGRLFFGFEKLLADIENTGGGYVVRSASDAEIVRGGFSPMTGAAQPANLEPRFDVFRELLAQKTVSQSGRAVDANAPHRNSPFLYSYLDFFPNGVEPTVHEVSANVTITAEFTPSGLITDPADTATFVERAFYISGRFELALPFTTSHDVRAPPKTTRKKHVVVVGGGPSACAAAFHLAKQTDRYKVTMYTQGFRFGGKCMAWPNPAAHHRIEEHGLHALVGFYRDMPRTLAEVFRVAYPDDADALFARALKPEPGTGLMHRSPGGSWRFLPSPSYPNNRVFATELFDGVPLSRKLTWAALQYVESALEGIQGAHVGKATQSLLGLSRRARAPHLDSDDLETLEQGAKELYDAFDAFGQGVEDALAAPLVTVKRLLSHGATLIDPSLGDLAVIAAARSARLFLSHLFRHVDPHEDHFFLWTGADVLLTALIGLHDEQITHYDQLDVYDYREWLHKHGSFEGAERWPTISFIYETLFASQDERGGKPATQMAAGVALRWFIHTAFLTETSPALRFQWSSGRTIFTPYYDALRKLGVDIHFFNVLVGLETTGTGKDRAVSALRFQRQADVITADGQYNPLVAPIRVDEPIDAHVLDWPMHVDLDPASTQIANVTPGIDFYDRWQFVDDPSRQYEVHQKASAPTDPNAFDECVLAIPLATLPLLECDLLKDDPRWKQMLSVAGVQTRSVQLWLEEPPADLYGGPQRGLSTCFEQPEPSYGDFTHLGKHEGWPAGAEPGVAAYLCGCLPPEVKAPDISPATKDYPASALEDFKAEMAVWLDEHAEKFFDRNPDELSFEDRLVGGSYDAQYYVAAVQPSDLYYISEPNMTQARLRQAETGVRHLLVAGDWTRTDWNAGCVEAATQSGMMAAHAISGAITTMHRVGF